MKPLVVIALESEGQGRLEALGLEVVYCGVGKVNAAYALTRRLFREAGHVSHVFNFGSAGSPVFKTGSLIEADRFVQRDMDVTGLGFELGHTPFENDPPVISFPRRFAHLENGVCGSGDSFLQVPSPIPIDVIDMEAYALAKICMREGLPFTAVKYITDGADHNASNDWQENLKLAAEAFVELSKHIR